MFFHYCIDITNNTREAQLKIQPDARIRKKGKRTKTPSFRVAACTTMATEGTSGVALRMLCVTTDIRFRFVSCNPGEIGKPSQQV
jgi:hypothetical protein